MAEKKFAVISNYGLETKTFTKCRDNWAFYSSHHPTVPFYVFLEESDRAFTGIHFNGYDYLIHLDPDKFPEETASTYDSNSVWSTLQMRRIFERWTRQIEYITRIHPDHFIVYVNITAFYCFTSLRNIINALPSTNVYAGWPLFYRPEGFFYHSGSGIIFSPDVAEKLVNRANRVQYSGHEAGDILWGRLLADVARTILPFAQVTPETLNTTKFIEYVTHIDKFIDSGHFLFRFKNSGLNISREHIDPPLQLYTMINSLKDNPVRHAKLYPLIEEEHKKISRGVGLTVIG